MAKHRVRRDATPPPPGWHDYVEHASEWILHHRFTILAAGALGIGLLGLAWTHWREAGGREAQAWQTMAQCTTVEELRRALPELEDSRAYPWAVIQVAASLYRQGRFQDALRALKPMVGDPDVDPYPKGYGLYLTGCAYLEEGRTEEGRESLEKALTVNPESSFLRERVSRVLDSLAGWPPTGSGLEGAEKESTGGSEDTGADVADQE